MHNRDTTATRLQFLIWRHVSGFSLIGAVARAIGQPKGEWSFPALLWTELSDEVEQKQGQKRGESSAPCRNRRSCRAENTSHQRAGQNRAGGGGPLFVWADCLTATANRRRCREATIGSTDRDSSTNQTLISCIKDKANACATGSQK